MLDTWISVLAGGGAGLATGAVASFVAPWANWGVEKRRQRRESRRKLIHEVRTWAKGRTDRRGFAGTDLCLRIWPHLTPEFQVMLDRSETVQAPGADGMSDRTFTIKLLDELAEVERHWGLV